MKRHINKIILSFVIPLIMLLVEVIFLVLSKQTLWFSKPWFFFTILLVLFFTPFVLRWEVKLITDILLFISIAVIGISNMYYLIKAGSSNINIYEFTNTPYFKQNSSSLNIGLMIFVSIIGLAGVVAADVMLRNKRLFILERSINCTRVQNFQTPIFVLFSSVIIILCYHLQVASNIKYNDFKSFVSSSSVANNHGPFAYGVYNLVNQSAKKRNDQYLIKIGTEQRDSKGNLLSIEHNEHLLYSPKNNNIAKNQNYLLLNIPGLTYEPLKEIVSKKNLQTIYPTLTKILVNANVYNNVVNTNPCFISEQQLFLGHIPSQPYFNSNLDVDLKYSLPMLLQKHNYQTFYLTNNKKDDYEYSKIYKHLGYTNLVSKSHLSSEELESITNEIAKLEDQKKSTTNFVTIEQIEKQISELKSEYEFLSNLYLTNEVTEISSDTLFQVFNTVNAFSKAKDKKYLISTTLNSLVTNNIVASDEEFNAFKEKITQLNIDYLTEENAIKYFYGLLKINNMIDEIEKKYSSNDLTIILSGSPYNFKQKNTINFLNYLHYKRHSAASSPILSQEYGKYAMIFYEKGALLSGIDNTISKVVTPFMIAPEIFRLEGITYPVKLFHGEPLFSDSHTESITTIENSFIFSKFYNVYGYNGNWYSRRKTFKLDNEADYKQLDHAVYKQMLIDSYFAFGINTEESI